MAGVRVRSLKITEDDVQKVIVDGLRAFGFLVLVTTVRVRRCPHCGRPGAGRYGTTPGVPDLLVRHKAWPLHLWAALEVKAPDGKVRPEQQALVNAGAIVIVRSLEDALAVVRSVR